MPLQNRVDPFGDIHAVADHGLFTGNRGSIHDPVKRTLLRRRWTTKAWIICDCGYKGLKRDVMGRNTPSGGAGWTNLFFLDEVTGLAAGHRPCFTCRRAEAKDFAARFAGVVGHTVSAPDMDEVLQSQRLAAGNAPSRIDPATIKTLPDGAMVSAGTTAYALRGGSALPWQFGGYGRPVDPAALPAGDIRLITPQITVDVLRAGYSPVWARAC